MISGTTHSFYHFQWCKFKPFKYELYTRKHILTTIEFVLHLRLPFNWKSPVGYFVALLMQCIEILYMTSAGVPVLCFLFQSCQLMEAFVQDISEGISHLDINRSTPNSAYESQSQVAASFVDFINNISTVKQLSRDATIFKLLSNFQENFDIFVSDLSTNSMNAMNTSSLQFRCGRI